MKKLNLLLILGLILSIGCHRSSPSVQIIEDTTVNPESRWVIYYKPDTSDKPENIVIPDFAVIDSLRMVIISRDSALFEARLKLARIWYYDSLCLKNSRLDKYLKGWVRRALEK